MDPVRLVVLGMGSGMAFGVGVVTLTVLGVDLVRPPVPPADLATGPSFYLLVLGTIAGLMLAGLVAWWLLAPLPTYRRGGLSLVAAFATVLPMLICMPVNQLAGRTGLGALAAAALGLSMLLGTQARRAGVAT
ncbi:MAG: hypothetical protein ACTHM9_12335 [Gemmatimonadales bacterium]